MRAQTGTAAAQLTRFNTQLKGSEAQANKSTNAIGGKLSKALKVAGTAAAAGAAYGLFKAVSAGSAFEKKMSALGAVSQATAKDMARLEAQALRLGESTAFTAGEAAEAQIELAKAGLTTKQILGGSLKAALNLAAAGEVSLAEAADTTAGALNMFKLKAGEAGKVSDMLATAANKTSTDVQGLSQALKQGGSVAQLTGIDLNNTVLVLEALAKATVTGADAGTSMKTSLLQLINPSTKQAKITKELGLNWLTQAGTMKGAVGITKELERVTGDMTKAERGRVFAQLAGTDGIRTLNALFSLGSKELKKYSEANQKTGTAQEEARKKMDNLSGDVEQLTGAMETLGIRLYQNLAPALRSAAQALTAIVVAIPKVVEWFGKHKTATTVLATAVASLTAAFVAYKTSLAITGAINAVRDAQIALNLAMIANPVGAVVAALAALGVASFVAYKKVKWFHDAVDTAFASLKGVDLHPLIAELGVTGTQIQKVGRLLAPVANIFKVLFGRTIIGVLRGVAVALSGFVGVVRGSLELVSAILKGDTAKAWGAVKTITLSSLKLLVGFLKITLAPMQAAAKAIDTALENVFGGTWDKIKGIFEDGKDAVVSVIEEVIDVLNSIPGIPDIDLGGGDVKNPSKGGLGKPRHRKARGGPINLGAPSGDSVPALLERGEYVLNRKAVAAVGKGHLDKLNFEHAPRYSVGSFIGGAADTVTSLPGKAVDAVGNLAGKGAGYFIGQLPKPNLPEPFAQLGPYLIAQVTDYIKNGFQEKKLGKLTGIGGTQGPKGVGSYKGVPMANWVIESLEYAASKGVAPQPTSGYRSHAKNVSEGRNYYSEHEKTQYPGGAVDFGGESDPAAEVVRNAVVAATRRFKYPLLALQGDDGHASGTGHKLGGLIEMLGEGGFAGDGYTVKGSAASSQQMHTASEIMEAADKTGAGHLPRVASMMAATQESNMGSAGNTFQLTGDFEGVSPSDRAYTQAVQWFTKGYWHGGGIGLSKKFSDPGDIAQEVEGSAYPDAYDPWKSEGQKWTDGWGGKGGSKEEDVKAWYGGARTDPIHFGGIPKSEYGIKKELGKRNGELKTYRKAAAKAHKAHKPKTEQAINENLRALEKRVRELERAKSLVRREKAKKAITKRFGKAISKLSGFSTMISERERDFDAQGQLAEQIVDLEPIMAEVPEKATNAQREALEKAHLANLTKYIGTEEEPAYRVLMERANDWRNTILDAENAAAGKWQQRKTVGGIEGNLEDKVIGLGNEIDRDQEFIKKAAGDVAAWKKKNGKKEFPDWLKDEVKKQHDLKAKIPILRFEEDEARTRLGEARESFYPGMARIKRPSPPMEGTGSFEDALNTVQGIHWPKQHEHLTALPFDRLKGNFGGVIWDVQTTIADLGMKIRDAAVQGGGPDPEDKSESAEYWEDQTRKANQRNLIFERQKPIIDAYEAAHPVVSNFAGMFAKGGSIAAGQWGIAGEAGPEIVQGPAQVFSNADSAGMVGGATSASSLHVHVYPDGQVTAELNGKQVQQVETIIEKKNKKMARGATLRTIGARKAGHLR